MQKLIATSKKLDIFFKVLQVLITIAMVCFIVGLGIIAVGFLFQLDPDQIGSGYNSVTVGPLKLEVAENFAPAKELVLIHLAVETALALIVSVICRWGIKRIRTILLPMTKGIPFHTGISTDLKRLATCSLILGIAVNALQIISALLWITGFDLKALLISEKITHVTFSLDFDLTFLVVAAVLLLLSHIFRYGEQLQQLSDETL